MNFMPFIAELAKPNDLWAILIDWIRGGIGNLGWTILLLTLLVKAVTIPLDFVVKLSQKKQTLVQQKCAPEVAKLQKKFGNDRQRLQIQTNALYKREGLKMGTSCIVMLVNMILTMVIFFTFFGSLRDVSAYEAIHQYEQVESSYTTTFTNAAITASKDGTIVSDAPLTTAEDVDSWSAKYLEAENFIQTHAETDEGFAENKAFVDANKAKIEEFTSLSANAAVATWEDIKDDWLWIQNIWVEDATTSPFPTYNGLKSMAKNAGKAYTEYVEANITEAEYNAIAGLIQTNETKNNGFYILAILAGVITFLSQMLSEWHTKLKNKKANKLSSQANPQAGSMKVLKIIMPIIMVMFVISSSASFGIYLLASNIATIIFGEIISLIVNAITKKKQIEVEEALEKEALRLMKKGKLQG